MKIKLFDGHCDTALRLYRKEQALERNTGHISLEQAAGLAGWAQFFAFFTSNYMDQPGGAELAFQKSMEKFRQLCQRNAERLSVCTDTRQAAEAIEQGKCAAFLSIEGAEAIGCDPGRLEQAYADGIRMVTLTWNYENALSGSCDTGSGLSAQGREFVRRAQKLGILVDVSHLSERGFWDICDIAEKPIVASHSNSKALCAHRRNLTDEQFKAICELGGTAGLNLYAPFVREDGNAVPDDVCRHAEHFLELGGDGHVAMGCDLDGCSSLVRQIGGLRDLPKLADRMQAWGFSQQTVENIFHRSLWRVVEKR